MNTAAKNRRFVVENYDHFHKHIIIRIIMYYNLKRFDGRGYIVLQDVYINICLYIIRKYATADVAAVRTVVHYII